MKKKLSVILVMTLLVFAFVPALTFAQETEETEEEEAAYENLDELLEDIEENEDLSTVERTALERKLEEYDQSLTIESISSVVDKVLTDEVAVGQGFVILSNIEESVNNGFDEERALELVNNYQSEEDNGQFAFQTALELRKLSREDEEGKLTSGFADEIDSILRKMAK
ncbi:MAG: hypothetical protein ACLFSO_06410 [Halanaerobium sp.]